MVTVERVTAENGEYPAISLDTGQVQGRKDIPLKENDSLDPLIPLGPFSQEAELVMTSSLYLVNIVAHLMQRREICFTSIDGSNLAYYESKIAAGEILAEKEMRTCNSRRLLFGIKAQVGFQPYFAEWWHFNAPESQMGAATARLDYATFGAVDLDDSNRAYENTHLTNHQEALKLQKEVPLRGQAYKMRCCLPFVKQATQHWWKIGPQYNDPKISDKR